MTKIPPIVKELEVPCDAKTAFEFYTTQMSVWWPTEKHSLSQSKNTQVFFESQVGGKIYEKSANGEVQVWGSVLKWNPYEGIVQSWHVGGAPDKASELELKFTEVNPKLTKIRLEHRNWEHFGEAAEETRGHYSGGWNGVLAKYTEGLK